MKEIRCKGCKPIQVFTKEELSRRSMPVLTSFDFEIGKAKYMVSVASKICGDLNFDKHCELTYQKMETSRQRIAEKQEK